MGELQAVIKPLGPMFRKLRAVGGTTILGNGSVALILDIPRLAQIASENAAMWDAVHTTTIPIKPEVTTCR